MERPTYKLEVFEGPMDLLLHLISKHKLSITDVSIFTLIEQYTEYVRLMQQTDMEVASEFLEMAARLVYIKTVSLLPVEHEQASRLRQELDMELMQYRDCKALAEQLRKNTQGFGRFTRQPAEIERDYSYKRRHTPGELLEKYLAAAGRAGRAGAENRRDLSELVAQKTISVGSRIIYIYRRLSGGARLRFSSLFEKGAARSQMVATFLALLELIKANKVTADDQVENPYITLKRRKERRRHETD